MICAISLTSKSATLANTLAATHRSVENYCKIGNFRENFIFANSVKTHIFDVENRDKGLIYLYQ